MGDGKREDGRRRKEKPNTDNEHRIRELGVRLKKKRRQEGSVRVRLFSCSLAISLSSVLFFVALHVHKIY